MGSPRVHWLPSASCSSRYTGVSGSSSPFILYALGRDCQERKSMCGSLSLSVISTPRWSYMSTQWAQSSISLAVARERADMGRPGAQGMRFFGSQSYSALQRRVRLSLQFCSSSALLSSR